MCATLSGQGTKRRGPEGQEKGEMKKKGLDPLKIEALVCKYDLLSFNAYLKLIQFFFLRTGAAQSRENVRREKLLEKARWKVSRLTRNCVQYICSFFQVSSTLKI